MNETAKYLMQNISGCKLAFVQSDEISLFISDYETPMACSITLTSNLRKTKIFEKKTNKNLLGSKTFINFALSIRMIDVIQ